MNIITVLRFLPLFIGGVGLFLALFSWTFGTPPTWTVFGPRERALVVETRIDIVPVGNGTTRAVPVIEVEWPLGSGDVARLGDVQSVYHRGPMDHAQAALADFTVGEEIAVRPYEGAPYADRLDWFGLAHAGFLTAFGVIVSGIGLLWARALRPRRT